MKSLLQVFIATQGKRVQSQHCVKCLASKVTWKQNNSPPVAKIRSFNVNIATANSKGWLIDVLREKVDQGHLIHDIQQEKVAKRLTTLQKALDGYTNQPIMEHVEALARQREEHEKSSENKENLKAIANNEPIKVPRGLFIHGKVGVGKSFLMDLFYDNVNVSMTKKRRVHFHSFMQDIHHRIHKLKQQDLIDKGRNFSIDTSFSSNPINRVAMQLADEVSLLCFDEFQVTDVADALILSQLFSILFSRGTVVVATSNRHPSTLYEGGLNRGYFLPFIDLLCRHCIVHDIDASIDYRSVVADGVETFFFNYNCNNDVIRYNVVLNGICNIDIATKKIINVAFNRKLQVTTNSDSQIAKFNFHELCNVELGSSDYRAIAQQFDLIIIEQIPQLSLKEHNQARRFITLIDELYEADCALVCFASTTPSDLFINKGTLSDDQNLTNAEDIKTDETVGIDVAQSNGVSVGGLASVRELEFAFRRAASRLKEICSKRHWEKKGII